MPVSRYWLPAGNFTSKGGGEEVENARSNCSLKDSTYQGSQALLRTNTVRLLFIKQYEPGALTNYMRDLFCIHNKSTLS